MDISVTSNHKGTDYCLHNLPFRVYGVDVNTPTEFFVFRAEDQDTSITARLFFTRDGLAELRDRIDRVLQEARAVKSNSEQGEYVT